jgi:hypothetical protein
MHQSGAIYFYRVLFWRLFQCSIINLPVKAQCLLKNVNVDSEDSQVPERFKRASLDKCRDWYVLGLHCSGITDSRGIVLTSPIL